MGATTRVAIIGAGNVGGGLGIRLSNSGLPVRFGVRPDTDTKAVLSACRDATASTPEEAAAWGEIVFLAIPAAAAVDVARRIRTGTVWVNAAAPSAYAPFGGYKQSGIGREMGLHGFREYQELKHLYIG